MVNRIQRARKELGLEVSDRIHVLYVAPGELAVAAEEYADYIKGEVLALTFASGETALLETEIDGMRFAFDVRRAD